MSDTIKLQAPANCGPFDRAGVTYTIDPDGTVSVPGDLYDDLIQHGFLPFVDKPAPTSLAGETDDDPNSAPVEDINTMGRMALFAFLSALGVSAPPPITNDQLRAKAHEAVAAQAAAKPAAANPAPGAPSAAPAATAPVAPVPGNPTTPAADPAAAPTALAAVASTGN